MTPTQYALYIAFTAAFALSAAVFLLAWGLSLLKRDSIAAQVAALLLAALTFVLNTVYLVVRGIDTHQMPIQSKFETYVVVLFGLALGYLIINLSMKMWSLRGRAGRFGNIVGFLTMAMGVGFALMALLKEDWEAMYRPPALKSVWMAPHVSTLIFGYGALFVAFSGALRCIWSTWRTGETTAGEIDWDTFLHKTMMVGFPFLTAGLFMGSIWGQEAWSTYWGWDIKETWALITWLVFLVYFHMRYEKECQGTAGAWVIVIGCGAIMLTWLGMSLLPDAISSIHVYN